MLHPGARRNAYTVGMYGYEPPKQDPEGSWGEILVMTRVVLGLILPPVLMILGVLALLFFTVWALFTNLLLAVVPVSFIVAGIWYLRRRDRRAQAELEEEIFGKRRP